MKYTKESLINLIKQKAKELGRTPSSIELGVHHSTICHRFGNMSNFIEEAKLLPFKQEKQKPNIVEKSCPICTKTFKSRKHFNKTFCSTKCSNISRRTPGWKPATGMNREEWILALQKVWKNKPFESFGWEGRRKRVIEEQNNKCNRCGNDTWMGRPLTLEVDHINGDRKDHSRENLEGLCPNCHSLTPTWKGKNRRTPNHLTDDELKSILESAPNICQGLTLAGMSPRGANYIRAKRLMNTES